MGADRRLRILARLTGTRPGSETQRLCDVCAEVTDLTGAGIMLMSADVPIGSVCTTDAVSSVIEQVQYDLGEGPCVDAYESGQPVLEPDLDSPRTVRWTGFTGPALAAGARAIFGFPMRVGTIRLGALNLYRDRSGPITGEQHADALAMADIAAQAVLVLQAKAPPGQLASELERGGDFHHVVHQASGMVAVQLAVSVVQAHVRLRAYAFGNGRPLTEVARDVVDKKLRFDVASESDSPR